MEIKDMHIGLEKREIRDFLSKTYCEAHYLYAANPKKTGVPYFNDNNGLSWKIEKLKLEKENIDKDIIALETLIAITNLVESNGWRVNSIVSTTFHQMSRDSFFIGTKEEYKEYMEHERINQLDSEKHIKILDNKH